MTDKKTLEKCQMKTWKDVLAEQKSMPYFQTILNTLATCSQQGKTVYPPKADIFNALRYTPLASVKVVILGQDPYHGPGQAHGLCFSVHPPTPPPPSLQNIFKALQDDCGISLPQTGSLIPWAKQGILLLNNALTVVAGIPQSHAKIGWERLTDKIIQVINDEKEGVVFLLWGTSAQQKGQHIDLKKHFVLRTTHPSPLSAHRGFLNAKHFSKTNALLERQGKTPINWQL